MICKLCRWEADGVKEGRFTHDEVADHNEKIWGSPRVGHAACAGGCDCRHHRIEADTCR